MGILNGLLGNASEVNTEKIEKEFKDILVDGEKIERAYKVIRDLFVFTNRRLVLVDKQGLTGKKAEYHTIPYRSITHFSVETSGHFDMDSELTVWISGAREPIRKEFKKGSNIVGVQKALAAYLLG